MKLQLKELRSIIKQVINEDTPVGATVGSKKVLDKIEGSNVIVSAMNNIKNAKDLQGLISGILSIAQEKGIDTSTVIRALSGSVAAAKKEQTQEKEKT